MRPNVKMRAHEFKGGYALLYADDLEAILHAYRDTQLDWNTLRVYAASHEQIEGAAKGIEVSLPKILHTKAPPEGVKRLEDHDITTAQATLDRLLGATHTRPSKRRKPAARRALRAIAQGRLSAPESIILLVYFSRRLIKERHGHQVREGQRYARFSYTQLEEITGIARAHVARCICSLCANGWLTTVTLEDKENESKYGACFIDGPELAGQSEIGATQVTLQHHRHHHHHHVLPAKREPTKRLTIEIPESLHRLVKVQCAKHGTSMYEEIRAVLESAYSSGDDN